MRHMAKRHSFGRRTGAKAALFKGLVNSLVEHGRIHTTLAKAKEIRRHVEKAITLGKKGDIGTRRVLISRYNQDTADKLITDVSKRFQKRPGGYTRILKTGLRAGDKAPMALIEFVDYVLPAEAKDKSDAKVAGDAGERKRVRAANKKKVAAKKRIRKIQAKSRVINRKKK